MGLFNADMVHQTHNIVNHLKAVLGWIMWLTATAVATYVEGDDPEPGVQKRWSMSGREPILQASAKTRNQDDGLSLSLIDVVNLHAVGIEELTLGDLCGRRGQKETG